MDTEERHSLGILADEGVPVLASRKRCRQGSLADDIAQSVWPAGPACLDELFNYPEQHLETIAQEPELMSRLSHLLQHGVVHSSDYTGMLAEREGLRLVLQAVQERTGSRIPYRFARACDLDQECQRFLWHSAQVQGDGQSCLFADIRCQIDLQTLRIAQMADRCLALGLHMKESGSTRCAWPMRDYMLTLKDCAGKSMTQSIPAICAWYLYVLSHTCRREKFLPYKAPSNEFLS